MPQVGTLSPSRYKFLEAAEPPKPQKAPQRRASNESSARIAALSRELQSNLILAPAGTSTSPAPGPKRAVSFSQHRLSPSPSLGSVRISRKISYSEPLAVIEASPELDFTEDGKPPLKHASSSSNYTRPTLAPRTHRLQSGLGMAIQSSSSASPASKQAIQSARLRSSSSLNGIKASAKPMSPKAAFPKTASPKATVTRKRSKRSLQEKDLPALPSTTSSSPSPATVSKSSITPKSPTSAKSIKISSTPSIPRRATTPNRSLTPRSSGTPGSSGTPKSPRNPLMPYKVHQRGLSLEAKVVEPTLSIGRTLDQSASRQEPNLNSGPNFNISEKPIELMGGHVEFSGYLSSKSSKDALRDRVVSDLAIPDPEPTTPTSFGSGVETESSIAESEGVEAETTISPEPIAEPESVVKRKEEAPVVEESENRHEVGSELEEAQVTPEIVQQGYSLEPVPAVQPALEEAPALPELIQEHLESELVAETLDRASSQNLADTKEANEVNSSEEDQQLELSPKEEPPTPCQVIVEKKSVEQLAGKFDKLKTQPLVDFSPQTQQFEEPESFGRREDSEGPHSLAALSSRSVSANSSWLSEQLSIASLSSHPLERLSARSSSLQYGQLSVYSPTEDSEFHDCASSIMPPSESAEDNWEAELAAAVREVEAEIHSDNEDHMATSETSSFRFEFSEERNSQRHGPPAPPKDPYPIGECQRSVSSRLSDLSYASSLQNGRIKPSGTSMASAATSDRGCDVQTARISGSFDSIMEESKAPHMEKNMSTISTTSSVFSTASDANNNIYEGTNISFSKVGVSGSASSYVNSLRLHSPSFDDRSETLQSPEDRERIKKRFNLIRELVETEDVFASDMGVVMDIYARLVQSDRYSGYLCKSDITMLFGKVERIRLLSRQFTKALRSAIPPYVFEAKSFPSEKQLLDVTTRIGGVFLDFIPLFEEPYKEYCNDNKLQMETFYRIKALACPLIDLWLEQSMEESESITKAWTLDALLIKPVQRLLKYPLLLNSLVGVTPDHHADYENLKQACLEMEACADRINSDRVIPGTPNTSASSKNSMDEDALKLRALATDHTADKALQDLLEEFYQKAKYVRALIHAIQVNSKEIQNHFDSNGRLAKAWLSWVMALGIDEDDHLKLKRYKHYALFSSPFTSTSSTLLSSSKLSLKMEQEVIAIVHEVWVLYERTEVLITDRQRYHGTYMKYLAFKAENPFSATQHHQEASPGEVYKADLFVKYHNSLKDGLPDLFELTRDIVDLCMEKYVAIQRQWFRMAVDAMATVFNIRVDEIRNPDGSDPIVTRFSKTITNSTDIIAQLGICNKEQFGKGLAELSWDLDDMDTEDEALIVSEERGALKVVEEKQSETTLTMSKSAESSKKSIEKKTGLVEDKKLRRKSSILTLTSWQNKSIKRKGSKLESTNE